MPQKVPLYSFIPNSLTTPNVLSHGDLKKCEAIDKPVLKKCISHKRRVVKVEKIWSCKLNPCELCRKRLSRSSRAVQQLSYQSYKLMALMEYTTDVIKTPFLKWPITVSSIIYFSLCNTAVVDFFVLRENGKFHENKMALWKWFRGETSNGHTYYAFGKEAALIFYHIQMWCSHESRRYSPIDCFLHNVLY